MTLREFQDGKGTTWQVWATRPETARVREERRAGWLTFEQGPLRRRLSPIPEGWETVPDDELRRLCVEARLEARAAHPGAPRSGASE